MRALRFSMLGMVVTCLVAVSISLGIAQDRTTAGIAALMEKARQQEIVRVIVRLKMEYSSESGLAEAAIRAQHKMITLNQTDFLRKTAAMDGVEHIRSFQTIPYVTLRVNAAALERLAQDGDVVQIEEDIPVPPVLNQSVPFINADEFREKGRDGGGYAVAVLDTGVRKTHEFLDGGKVISEACYSTTDGTYGSTTVCPGGGESQIGSGAGVNCNLSIDGCDHGTHVAGIAAGTGGSASGAPSVGVAPGADIIAIQVFSKFNSSTYCGATFPCALSYTSDQIAGLERVYELRSTHRIAAVNMSIGGGQYSGYCDTGYSEDVATKAAIDNLRAVGIATVVAAGNDGLDHYVSSPGCISTAITVGATMNNSDYLTYYTNYAYMVDLLAPGSDINSSDAKCNTCYVSWSGTSMATPHVAGAFALMKDAFPSWSVAKIETYLKSTGVNITWAGITKPRINLFQASEDIKDSNVAPINYLLLKP